MDFFPYVLQPDTEGDSRSGEQAGLPPQTARKLAYNSCHRFLPALSDVLGFPRHARQAIGNWTDKEAVRSESGGSRTDMSIVYSDARAVSSGAAKALVFNRFLHTLSGFPDAAEAIRGGICTPEVLALSWEDLALANQAPDAGECSITPPSHTPLPALPAPAPPLPICDHSTSVQDEAPRTGPLRNIQRVDKRASYRDRGT